MEKNDTIEYSENLISYTRKQLVDKVQEKLDDKRFQHCLRVEKQAMELANENNVDPEKAAIAGLLHDYAKQRSDHDFIKVINDKQMNPVLLDYGNAIWHGVVGAELIKDELHIYDEDILNAVRRHTVGAAYMTKLDQIVYMADYIEPGRDFPGVDKARQITHESLKKGVFFQTQQTLSYLVENAKPIYPGTIATYNAWQNEK
ncbi:bis(5'-nucleosyl)-tetraphosphatase (symmetrical) YqeK [Pediococcus parvulus]|uniref:bis(5'-nucleosyl)-tetraphosphatase (symmetrical) YqeK n=1 Tax=Pediococcus parvulus TaxID=54062 RepID=UPI00345EE302